MNSRRRGTNLPKMGDFNRSVILEAVRRSGEGLSRTELVDVTGLSVDPGDEVVIIGRQGDAEITARDMAAAIGTIPWEIVCRLGARVGRRYEGSAKYEVRSTRRS